VTFDNIKDEHYEIVERKILEKYQLDFEVTINQSHVDDFHFIDIFVTFVANI